MSMVIGLIILLLGNIAGFTIPALLAAWLFTLALPMAFNQALWLSLGMIIAVSYIIQSITDVPGKIGYGLLEIVVSVIIAVVIMALAGLFGWLLLLVVSVDLTSFEATLLFAITLVAGLFFLSRSGSVGWPRWMVMPDVDLDDEDFADDYVIPPARKQPRRKKRSGRR